jgi:hypothetical protein
MYIPVGGMFRFLCKNNFRFLQVAFFMVGSRSFCNGSAFLALFIEVTLLFLVTFCRLLEEVTFSVT